jgi:hypothetical protein
MVGSCLGRARYDIASGSKSLSAQADELLA